MNTWSCRFIVFAAALIATACTTTQSNINCLAVGKLATIRNTLQFPANGLRNFCGLTKSEVLAIRSRAILEHAELINGNYVPSESVFGQIQDGRPWWGLQGVSFYGRGPNSSRGQSWHSQQICNPFILVVADICPLTYSFDRMRFADVAAVDAAGCPTRCQPSYISMNPNKSQGSVIYAVNQYLQQANMFLSPGICPTDLTFELEACNARDLGYNFLYVDTAQSPNVTCPGAQRSVHLVQFFHCGTSCGIPGGCNNMSPTIKALENFKLTGLPARCHILLWKDDPNGSMRNPNFTFDINFN